MRDVPFKCPLTLSPVLVATNLVHIYYQPLGGLNSPAGSDPTCSPSDPYMDACGTWLGQRAMASCLSCLGSAPEQTPQVHV